MKNIAFTTNFGDYDNLALPYSVGRNWFKVLFTDSKQPQKRGWDRIIVLPESDRPDLQAKLIKWGIHKHFPQAEWYLHYDANMVIKNHIEPQMLRIKHGKRSSVLEECHACNAQQHRWTINAINNHYNVLVEDGYPDDNGLFLNGFHIRPNSEVENKIGDEVCEHLTKYTTRDQIIFPYVLWKNNKVYEESELRDFNWFLSNIHLYKHKHNKIKLVDEPKQEEVQQTLPPLPEPKQKIKIYSFTPFASDKNYGKILNEHCELVPNDNDWILVRDSDTSFLIPEFSQQIQAIVDKYHDKFDLIGCYTNRLGLNYQLIDGKLSEDVNIKTHIKIAQELHKRHGSTVTPLNKNIGGLFLLFPKRAWKEHKFEEGLKITKVDYDGKTVTGYFDYWFSNYFARKGRVGIANGVYLLHIYRLFAPNRQYQEHLK